MYNNLMDYVKTNILVEREPLQAIKKLLIDRRISLSRWVRGKIDEELAMHCYDSVRKPGITFTDKQKQQIHDFEEKLKKQEPATGRAPKGEGDKPA